VQRVFGTCRLLPEANIYKHLPFKYTDVCWQTNKKIFFNSSFTAALCIYIIKGNMSVCLLPMAGRTAGPIKTKLSIGTHVDPGSVLVKVKVIWRHLVNANKTPYRGPQGSREFEHEVLRGP